MPKVNWDWRIEDDCLIIEARWEKDGVNYGLRTDTIPHGGDINRAFVTLLAAIGHAAATHKTPEQTNAA